ncbi:MAG: globin domain-containing protein [Pseudomonadota bacterium]
MRIRKTWSLAAAIPEQVAHVFYANLFRTDPSTKPLFVGDLELQGRKLIQTLGFIVDHLDEQQKLLPAAQELAIRHVSYGVSADQYASVGTALIKTLKQLLGADFSREDEIAWAETYSGLSDAMIEAAYAA